MSNVFFIGRTDLVDSQPHGSVYQVTLDAKILKIYGGFRSFFLFGYSDDVWVFGDNSHGQLGLSEICDIQKKPQRLYCNYELMSCGEQYTYAYNWEGLYYWGENNFCCSPFKGLQLDPKQLPQKNITQLCTQNERFYYIQHSDLYGCGFTDRLGVKLNVVSTTKPLLIMARVSRVACSSTHSLLLDETGRVYVWGNGKNGELGLQMVGYSFFTSVSTPTLQPHLKDIEDVQCGDHYSLALNNKGLIYEWGNGFNKNLSFEEALKIKEVKMPNKYANVRKINVSLNQAACVDQLGRLYTWSSTNPSPKFVKTGFRCEEFICGDGIVVFVGSPQAYQVSEHFKLQVKEQVKKFKDYVDLKNSKVRNVFYDDNKRNKCLQELNAKYLEQPQKPLQTEDLLIGRFKRKPSLYMLELKRRSTMMVSELQTTRLFSSEHKRFSTMKFELIKEQIKNGHLLKINELEKQKQLETNQNAQGSWENFKQLSKQAAQKSEVRSRIQLNVLNPKLYQAIEIDKVSDLILESERTNPLYIPLNNIEQYKNSQSQPLSLRESQNDQRNKTGNKEFINDPDIMKYEYVKRIYNGYHEKLLMDNLMTQQQCFLPIKWKRLKDDTKLFQGRFNRMQQRLMKEQREAKKLVKIREI